MASEDYLARVVAELSDALQPLADALQNPLELTTVLAGLGWELDGDAASGLSTILQNAGTALTKLDADARADAGLATLAADVTGIVAALVAAAAQTAPGLPAPLDRAEFWQTLPDDLLEMLLVDHLSRRHQLTFGLLAVLGVVHLEQRPADAVSGRLAFRRRGIRPDRLVQFIGSPEQAVRDSFGWGAVFDHEAAVWALGALLQGLRADSVTGPATDALLAEPYDPLSEHRGSVSQLVVSAPALSSAGGTAVAKAALVVLPVPPAADPSAPPEGIVLMPIFFGQVAGSFTLGDAARLTLSGTATDTPIQLFLRPSGVEVTVSVAGVQAELAARLDVAPTAPLVLAGDRDGSRLELHKAHLRFGVTATPNEVAVDLEAVFDQLRLVVDAGEGDGFLSEVFGSKPLEVDVAPGLAWSSRTGLRFAGQASLQLDVPLDVSVAGVAELEMLILRAQGRNDGAAVIEIGLSGNLRLGPFAVAVDQIGIAVRVRGTDSAHPGNLGAVDLGFGFKPPTGIGLAIDTPAVRGGGFLLIDPDAGQYAGVFELTIVGTVSVKAVAIISTRLPDGQPGFALLVVITADGFTAVQLGMGFSLTGIGGLLALNRTIDIDVVRNGLRDGVLDSILFVKDPVKNAPRIISTLNRVFPLAPGRLVIGPLAEISWGGLVKIRLALLLEIPQPVRVMLLAQLSMLLPNDTSPVVELHVDAVGSLDLGRGELSLDASIHDSRLLALTLSGDLALRLAWGTAPTFVLSVGGFHPKFPMVAGLRRLNRITLSLSRSDNPRIQFEAYLALTSNSIQMGARLTVYAAAGGFGVDGGGSFDALIMWSPFYLDVSMEVWVRIFGPTGTLLGARLGLEVSGPEPWHISGVAEITILFITIRVGVDFQIGEARTAPARETVDVAAALWAEISRPDSWQAVLPAAASPGATLADPSAAAPSINPRPLVMHPLASLVGRQRVAPLDRTITRMGARLPTAGTRSYSLLVGAPTGVRVEAFTDLFAPAQYEDLPEDAKLSGPSFVAMTAGARLMPESAHSYPSVGIATSDLTVETLDVISLDSLAATAGTATPTVLAAGSPPTTGRGSEPARLLAPHGGMLS